MNTTRTPAPPAEVCEICATPIGEQHHHLVDVRQRRLLCSCYACHMLFVPKGAAQGRYLAVGERFAALPAATFSAPHWDALQIPIGLAFFFNNSATGRINAFYPGAGGATESELALEAWEALADHEPLVAAVRPDVEAILVYRRRDDTSEGYIVPIDACYELVALVRMHWSGFDGGDDVHRSIDDFFERVKERCT